MSDAKISVWNSLYNRARLHPHFGCDALQSRAWILEESHRVEAVPV
ncbi:hypothetical protein [Mastigocladopsis repens]|nr:hypothetical protein [Mastigocladopsis repens]